MKHWGFWVIFAIFMFDADGASLLTAQKFPKTANDLTFTQRVQLLTNGYKDFESQYDINGNCISGCLYPGITVAEEVAAINTNTNVALQDIQSGNIAVTSGEPAQYPQHVQSVSNNSYTQQAPANTGVQLQPPTYDFYTQQEYASFDSQLQVPMGANPIKTIPLIVSSPVGKRNVTGGSSVHRGIDLVAARGTPVYATAAGTVVTVAFQGEENGRIGCGKYIEIKHSHGYKTQYCHLDEQLVHVGDTVSGGDLIGRVGNTGGKNMSPHLHYRIDIEGKNKNDLVDAAGYLKPGTWKCATDVAEHPNCTRWITNQI